MRSPFCVYHGHTADMLDVPYLKALYKDNVLRYMIADILEEYIMERKSILSGKLSREQIEKLKMLDKIVYELRTRNFIQGNTE